MTRPLPSSVDTVIVGRYFDETVWSLVENPEADGEQEMARQH